MGEGRSLVFPKLNCGICEGKTCPLLGIFFLKWQLLWELLFSKECATIN
jgi:hypothetical protein